MAVKELRDILTSNKSYMNIGYQWLAENFGCTIAEVEDVLTDLQEDVDEYRGRSPRKGTKLERQANVYIEKIKARHPNIKFSRMQVSTDTKKRVPYKRGDPNNVLYIGDLHAPFILDGYLDFNVDLQKKYNAGTVIFAGDIVDGHSWSYHEHDVDGMGVADEMASAIKQLTGWYKAFPDAYITYGNHDLLISRKMRTIGLSQAFMRQLGDIIDAPEGWKFVHELIKDNVYYTHGSNGNAIVRATKMRKSVAQGHLHSEAFVQWSVSEIDAIFGLQVGCGLDRNAYAFEYGKPYAKKPVICSGLILDKGRLPLIELMRL